MSKEKDIYKEIQKLYDKLAEVEEEKEKLDRYNSYLESANELMLVKKSFEEAGFSEEQAFEILILSLSKFC